MKIAVVEDNEIFADNVKLVLQKEGYEVDVYYNANSFLSHFSKDIDLILLDINLPDKNGLEILEILRDLQHSVKVIFVSSHTEIKYLKEAYKLGCEDYIKKPFEIEELLLRVDRIKKLINPSDIINMGEYQFDLKNFIVIKDDIRVKITKKEAELLRIFLANIDNVVTFDYLNAKIWNAEVVTNTIIVAVLRLKNKLGLPNIKNIREVGYIFHKI